MSGFFRQSEVIGKSPAYSLPRCGECGLYKRCKSPKMPVSGKGERKILIVGEAPGEDEDEQSEQFVGETGSLLKRTLGELGCDMRTDCWLTNALICRPPDNEIEDNKMIDWCRPNLVRTIRELQPEIVIPLGRVAIQSLIPQVWRGEDIGGIMRWAGWRIPCQRPNMWICPTYHPSWISRTEEKTPCNTLHWKRHLKRALKLRGRPWDVVPDYKSQVRRIFTAGEAAEAVRGFLDAGKPIAFDYEGNMLKPDDDRWAIVSCSISDGETTVAFPWHGKELISAMRELLRSPIPKVASNLKLEERWTRKAFGRGARNWFWDTMIAARWADCRREITGLKFQAFVQLGAESYDDKLKPFLKAGQDIKVNRILEEIDLDRLLLYNGLDSLLEILVARKQMKQAGISFPGE